MSLFVKEQGTDKTAGLEEIGKRKGKRAIDQKVRRLEGKKKTEVLNCQ
jgi:hypothetical protein